MTIAPISGKTSLVLSPRGFHNATIGDALIFECQASGFPIPRVQWAYPSTDLRNKVKLTSWPGYARIEMEALPAVEGEYVCKASNVDGEAMDAILLKGMFSIFTPDQCNMVSRECCMISI